jgi:hypothetical protein
MDIDANINIEIDDSDIVDAVRSELEAAISAYDESNPLHKRIDWDSAHRSGQMTFNHTDDEVRSLIREIIELNPEVLRPIIAAQVDAAVLYRVQDTVRNEITKWVHSLGSVFANMTHNYNTRENHSE